MPYIRPLLIKSVDDASGTFTGLASVFDNLDHNGDIVRRGAFSKSLASGTRRYRPTTVWRSRGRFDLDTEFGKSAYRNTKGRRVSGLSIGYAIRNSTKTAAGNELTDLELIEVSIVARGANDRGSGRT